MPSDDPESRNALLESLKFPFMNARYFSITHAHPGTCDWLFETSEFQTWRDQADSADGNRALWIKGEPGSGKSTMMKHTLEYCQKEFANHSTISHFFDSGGATLEKTMLGMLQSLVSQLLHQNGQLSDVFFNFFRGKLRVQEQSDWQWFQLELENFLRLAILQPSAKPLIILIDAIDECTELEAQNGFSFLEGLSHLSDKKGVTLRLCISSHSWHSLEAKQNKIGLALPDRQGHLRDISLYLGDTPLSSNHNVKDTILNGCKGNFLWVVMIVAALNRSHAGDQSGSVQKRLGRVPTCIEDIVDTLLILGNVSEEQNSTERTLLLQLVGLSNRPLRLGEVCAAIGKAFVGNETQERYITNLSEGLVIARKHQGGDVFVHFIHNMVNDYLLSEWRLRILSPELGRHPVQASHPIQASHGRLWACCLEQIQILTENSMGGQDTRAMSLSHPFLSYAADHMLYHAEMAWKSMTYREQIEIWLKKKGSWFIWMKKYRNIEEDLGLLHVVILDGLPNLIDVLLAQNVGIMTGSEKRDTLQALAFSGSDTRLLEILLVHGAVIDDQGGKYGNALQAALRGGDEKVVEFLLMNGAGDRGHSSPWGTGFDTALRMGNPAIIDLILGFGAEDDYDSETMYVNALQAAAGVAGDNEETMSLLVNRSADVNTEGGFWGTALQVAVFKGNKRIVQLLIDEGANINASVGFHGNALQVAAETGNKEIASLLINKGADPNAEGGIYGTAFLTAAAWGHLKVMDLLLSHGADIEAESGEIGNALCTASYDNNLEMVEFLLERGANPNAGLGPHGNPLQAAAITLTGRLDVVKLLIARGSDINAQCGTYGSALCAALAAHNSEIVRYLLKKGARTDLRDSFNRTALHYAVEGSSLEMIQELLNQGASPEEVDDAQARPLDVAIQNRDSDIIRLLFRHTENMPTMSANDWRDCLGWTSNSYMKLCISQPRRIERHGEALQQSLVDQLFPVIHSAREPMERSKIDSLVKSMSKANVYILPTGKLLYHLKPCVFNCRWWRKKSHTRRSIIGHYQEPRWTWSVHSNTFPRDDIYRRLKADEHFMEIGFRAPCLKVSEQTWPRLQNHMQIDEEDEAICDEGFICIMAPIPIEPSQGVDRQERAEDWRPVYLLSTMDNSPIALPLNGEQLLRPLISKFNLIVEENCAVATGQLSKSRSQVLDKSGCDPKLLAQLLHNAQILERMTENHKILVQSLEMFWKSLSSVHHKQWKVGVISNSHSTELGSQFEAFVRLDRRLRELEEKSQGIIQLEFNLTSILEAQRSTSTNKSMKRLSWITFVFLPLVFIASLFGMNVDVLANNPSWWWYFPLSGACMLSTLAVWLCFKRFSTLEGRLERHFWWLTRSEKQADVEQGLARPEKRREQTAKYSMYGKKRS